MVRQIVCAVLMAGLIGGCGTWEVERLSPISKLSCVKVADVTASSPAATEIIREQLKAELQKNGLNVTDDCEYKIDTWWEGGELSISSRVKLSDNKKTLIIWTYCWNAEWDVARRSSIDFAKQMARRIAEEVK